jgi:hypothetical protein
MVDNHPKFGTYYCAKYGTGTLLVPGTVPTVLWKVPRLGEPWWISFSLRTVGRASVLFEVFDGTVLFFFLQELHLLHRVCERGQLQGHEGKGGALLQVPT